MNELRTAVIAACALALMLGMLVAAAARTEAPQTEAEKTYATKCVACHGKKAEKKFDASLSDDQLVDAILKGKKAEKPPNMPAYGEKGVTAEQAKALVDYMKQLKAAP